MDVTGTLSPAWRRTKRVLFQPFDVGAWLSFGVIFFLQSLSEGGAGYSYRGSTRSSSRGGTFGVGNLKDLVDSARTWLADNAATVIAVGAVLAVVGLALGLVVLWLGTRGQMMAIRAVATGRPAIGEHWRATQKAGWSLFELQLVLGVVGFVLWAPLLALAVYRFVDLVDGGITDEGALVLAMVPFGVVGLALAAVFGALQSLIRNFVAPMMLRFDLAPGAAWTRLRQLAPGSAGAIALFLLIRFGLGLGVSVVGTALVFCTCCIGALPVLQQTLLAPWYVFERAYGLHVLDSIGPDMKMLVPLPDPAAPPPPGGGFAPPPPPPAFSSWNPQ